MQGGRGERDLSGGGGAPRSRPSLTRGLPSPAEGEGDDRPNIESARLGVVVGQLLQSGARWFWFRERDMEADSRKRLACELLAMVRMAGGVFTLGGNIDLAAAIEADGVHLSGNAGSAEIDRARRAMPNGLIGVSAHSLDDIDTAAGAGADYATLSPIFATPSKPGYGPALGLDALRVAARCDLPILALGGITLETASACREAGAAGIAVMGSVMRSSDPAGTAGALLEAWSQAPEGP
nr:thiamine phosphate synthase [Methylobacterium iners]